MNEWSYLFLKGKPIGYVTIMLTRAFKSNLLCSLYANIKSQDLLYSQINSLGNALQFIDTNTFEIHPARNEKCDSEIA